MKRFLQKSVIIKAAFFSIILVSFYTILLIVLKNNQIQTISLNIFFINLILVLLLIFVLFLIYIGKPLDKISTEVKALLTGKTYKRIIPTTIDEIGIFTHFFNEITLNLEKISTDLKEGKRMSSELDIASKIQNDVLPKEAPEIRGLDIVAKTRSAAEVGGDCFDFMQKNENFYVYIGDVTGHGVPAGLVMIMVDTLMHAWSQTAVSSEEILVQINRFLNQRMGMQRFMTLVMLRWDELKQKMYYIGAGHEHVLVYRAATKKVDVIRSGGIALRMIPDISKIVKEQPVEFEKDDVIVLYTDGITEAKNKENEMYGIKRLVASLERNGRFSTSEKVFDNLTKDFRDFVDEYVQADDITMIVVKNTGPEEEKHHIKLTINADEERTFQKSKVWDWE